MVGGTLLAGWPTRRRRRRTVPTVPPQEAAPEVPEIVPAGQA
jgi:hypothetical protein